MIEPIIREFREDDIDDIIRIMDDEWSYHIYGPGWESLIRMYVQHFVAESDYRVVAESDGKLIGTIMAATDYGGEEPVTQDQIEEALGYPCGRKAVDDFNEFARADSELISGIDHEGFGKVVLLILSKDAKGLHLGGKLFRGAMDHFKANGKRGFLLVTDTDCNMGFYNHMGLKAGGTRHIRCGLYQLDRLVYSMVF